MTSYTCLDFHQNVEKSKSAQDYSCCFSDEPPLLVNVEMDFTDHNLPSDLSDKSYKVFHELCHELFTLVSTFKLDICVKHPFISHDI